MVARWFKRCCEHLRCLRSGLRWWHKCKRQRTSRGLNRVHLSEVWLLQDFQFENLHWFHSASQLEESLRTLPALWTWHVSCTEPRISVIYSLCNCQYTCIQTSLFCLLPSPLLSQLLWLCWRPWAWWPWRVVDQKVWISRVQLSRDMLTQFLTTSKWFKSISSDVSMMHAMCNTCETHVKQCFMFEGGVCHVSQTFSERC